nr:reverse transcriptase domain-containing protein [Tanacetum cinerariifolium]
MMRKFLSKYFPPSMVTKLRNEIMNFRQDPNESLFKEWEHYKLSIDRRTNHNLLLVTQINTFYNGLTLRHQDTINVAVGGTFMKKRPKECYDLIENMTAHYNHWDTSATRDETSRTISSTTTTKSLEVVRQLEMTNKNFQDMMKQIQYVKYVNLKCETCGGPHSFIEYPTISSYIQEAAYATTVNQINVIDVACEEYVQEVLGFSNSSMSGNPTPSDPIIATSSPSFTPFEGGDFILEEIETFLHNPDELLNLDDDYYDTEGDILYLDKLLNEDPSSSLPPMKNEDLKQVDVTMTKPSIEEPSKIKLKDLPSHL